MQIKHEQQSQRYRHKKTPKDYFFRDIMNNKNFDLNSIKVDEKSFKNILIYYIGYVTVKDSKYVKINAVNPLYIIFSKVNEYFEEINKNKYLTLLMRA